MAEERKRKLENKCHLFQLKREASDLEQWIREKEETALSSEMGQDFDHVIVSTRSLRCVFLTREPSLQTHTRTCHLQSAARRGRHSSGRSGCPGEV